MSELQVVIASGKGRYTAMKRCREAGLSDAQARSVEQVARVFGYSSLFVDSLIQTIVDATMVTVCDRCLCASCWQGEFYCDDYRGAGTTELPRAKLKEMALEDPSYWDIDPDTGVAKRNGTQV